MQDLVLKVTKSERAAGVAQVIEHLPSKFKVLCPEFNKP
jgi:hypothetical protein